MTLIPTKMYFNKKGLAKIEIGIGKGRKIHDKREVKKTRDWERQKARLLKIIKFYFLLASKKIFSNIFSFNLPVLVLYLEQ